MGKIEKNLCIPPITDPDIREVAESAAKTIWNMTTIPAPFVLYSSPVQYDKGLHDVHAATKKESGNIVGAYAFPILFTNQSGKVCRRGKVFFA